MMEWDEFTRFVVVKAQLHHAQMSIDQLAEYRQGFKQVVPRRGSILPRERRNTKSKQRNTPRPSHGRPISASIHYVRNLGELSQSRVCPHVKNKLRPCVGVRSSKAGSI